MLENQLKMNSIPSDSQTALKQIHIKLPELPKIIHSSASETELPCSPITDPLLLNFKATASELQTLALSSLTHNHSHESDYYRNELKQATSDHTHQDPTLCFQDDPSCAKLEDEDFLLDCETLFFDNGDEISRIKKDFSTRRLTVDVPNALRSPVVMKQRSLPATPLIILSPGETEVSPRLKRVFSDDCQTKDQHHNLLKCFAKPKEEKKTNKISPRLRRVSSPFPSGLEIASVEESRRRSAFYVKNFRFSKEEKEAQTTLEDSDDDVNGW